MVFHPIGAMAGTKAQGLTPVKRGWLGGEFLAFQLPRGRVPFPALSCVGARGSQRRNVFLLVLVELPVPAFSTATRRGNYI